MSGQFSISFVVLLPGAPEARTVATADTAVGAKRKVAAMSKAARVGDEYHGAEITGPNFFSRGRSVSVGWDVVQYKWKWFDDLRPRKVAGGV